MTVPSSSHAAKNGSQWSPKMLGQPSLDGFSENVTAWQPFLATRCTSVRHQLRVPDRRDRQRDEPARVGAAPLVDVPVVVAPQQTRPMSRSFDRENSCPQNCTKRREAHRAEHAVAVHVVDALVDVVAARADHLVARRLDVVLLGRPARDRVEPDVRDLVALVDPHVDAVVLVDALRRATPSTSRAGGRSKRSGGSTTWSSTLTRIRSSARMGSPLSRRAPAAPAAPGTSCR